MPDKPTWYGRLDAAIAELKGFPHPWVDRATVERLLGVGRRRAQQILQPCITHRIGSNGLANRGHLIARLEQLASGDSAQWEKHRRKRLADEIERLRSEWLNQPKVLIEAPARVTQQRFAGLEGITVMPGIIHVEFDTPQDALEKLLALAMAIGNDFHTFDRLASGSCDVADV
jgi:hypothetical protein